MRIKFNLIQVSRDGCDSSATGAQVKANIKVGRDNLADVDDFFDSDDEGKRDVVDESPDKTLVPPRASSAKPPGGASSSDEQLNFTSSVCLKMTD